MEAFWAESMIQNIISGIIFSEFNDIMGPEAIAFFPPDISQESLKRVSTITIDYFMNESAHQKTLYLLPFPLINKKGLVRSVIWPEPKKRGGEAMGSLTLLFEENQDSIFYKYSKDLEDPIDRTAKKLMEERSTKKNVKDLQKILEDLHSEIENALRNLSKQELQIKDQFEEFPVAKSQPVQKIKFNFKIIVVGDPAVGKTSTILRFSDNAFRRSYIPTVGANISQKFLQNRGNTVQLMLWDLAGQAKYQQARHQFYQGAQAAILVYDLTDRSSFANIPKWHSDVVQSLGGREHDLPLILCGNKKDLEPHRKVSSQEGQELAKQLQVNFLETSALTGENVNESFLQLIDHLVRPSSPENLTK